MHTILTRKIEVPIALGAGHRCRHVGAVGYLLIIRTVRPRQDAFVVAGCEQQCQNNNARNLHHCVTPYRRRRPSLRLPEREPALCLSTVRQQRRRCDGEKV
jgi:hypothetical protein